MQDRNLSAHHVLAAAFWLLAAGLIVAGIKTGSVGLGHLGLMSTGAAVTANVRGFFCNAIKREQAVFELGREYGSGSNAEVRSLR